MSFGGQGEERMTAPLPILIPFASGASALLTVALAPPLGAEIAIRPQMSARSDDESC